MNVFKPTDPLFADFGWEDLVGADWLDQVREVEVIPGVPEELYSRMSPFTSPTEVPCVVYYRGHWLGCDRSNGALAWLEYDALLAAGIPRASLWDAIGCRTQRDFKEWVWRGKDALAFRKEEEAYWDDVMASCA